MKTFKILVKFNQKHGCSVQLKINVICARPQNKMSIDGNDSDQNHVTSPYFGNFDDKKRRIILPDTSKNYQFKFKILSGSSGSSWGYKASRNGAYVFSFIDT